MSKNWKIAILLDAASGFAAYVLWSRGVIGLFEAGCIVVATAIIATGLTHFSQAKK